MELLTWREHPQPDPTMHEALSRGLQPQAAQRSSSPKRFGEPTTASRRSHRPVVWRHDVTSCSAQPNPSHYLKQRIQTKYRYKYCGPDWHVKLCQYECVLNESCYSSVISAALLTQADAFLSTPNRTKKPQNLRVREIASGLPGKLEGFRRIGWCTGIVPISLSNCRCAHAEILKHQGRLPQKQKTRLCLMMMLKLPSSANRTLRDFVLCDLKRCR